MDLTQRPPWSKKSIDRVGRAIRNDQPFDQDKYMQFLLWSGDIIDEIQRLIQTTLEINDRMEITIPTQGIRVIEKVPVKLTGRPKTLDTTREKLRRMPEFQLSRIQDICGLRLDGDFSLDQQDLIVSRLQDVFLRAGAQNVEAQDLRETPRQGYRAVHVNANFPAGRVEVQVRTKLQSAWANAFELLADIYGREIRYERIYEDPVQSIVTNFQSISDSAYEIDKFINDINRYAIETHEHLLSISKDTGESRFVQEKFAMILGTRALAIGNQIDVVDRLDEQRDNLISQRVSR